MLKVNKMAAFFGQQQQLNIFASRSVMDVWRGSKYATGCLDIFRMQSCQREDKIEIPIFSGADEIS